MYTSNIYTVRSSSFRTDLLFKNQRHMRKTHTFFKLKISSIDIYTGFGAVEQFLKSCQNIPLFGPSLIHQLRLLGSQQHPQSGVLLTSFSTLGRENSLAEINLESTGVINGCNIFGVKNWQTLAVLWAGTLSCNEKKSREQKTVGRTRWLRFRRRSITPL